MRRGTKLALLVLAVLALPITMFWRVLMFDADYSYTARKDVQLILDPSRWLLRRLWSIRPEFQVYLRRENHPQRVADSSKRWNGFKN